MPPESSDQLSATRPDRVRHNIWIRPSRWRSNAGWIARGHSPRLIAGDDFHDGARVAGIVTEIDLGWRLEVAQLALGQTAAVATGAAGVRQRRAQGRYDFPLAGGAGHRLAVQLENHVTVQGHAVVRGDDA